MKRLLLLPLIMMLLTFHCSTPVNPQEQGNAETSQEAQVNKEAAEQEATTEPASEPKQGEPTPDVSEDASSNEEPSTQQDNAPGPDEPEVKEETPDTTQVSCSDIATFATGKSPTRTLYVGPKGSNTSGDGSEQKPYATLEFAVKKATPGTAVRMLPGTYKRRDNITDVQGTASAPIWVGGIPGQPRPILEGGSEGIHLTKVSYLVLENIEIRNTKNNGINSDDGGEYNNDKATQYVVFRNLHIHDVGGTGNQDCLKLSGLRHYYVLDSLFEKCGGKSSGSGVDHVGCHHGLIARNTFRNLNGNAVQNKGGSTDIEIRWNKMMNSGERAVNMGGSTGFAYFRPPLSKSSTNAEARNIRVIANLIQGSNAPVAFVGCVDCLAANNTIVDPKTWVLRILQETKTSNGYTFAPASKGRFINNLIYFKRSQIRTYMNIGANTEPKTFTLSNNLWFAYDDASRSKPSGLPVAEANGLYGKNPEFVDGGKGDYQLKSSSPALGAGMSLKEVVGALNSKCFQTPPSIGAYEE